jgi:hypothetical protein
VRVQINFLAAFTMAKTFSGVKSLKNVILNSSWNSSGRRDGTDRISDAFQIGYEQSDVFANVFGTRIDPERYSR